MKQPKNKKIVLHKWTIFELMEFHKVPKKQLADALGIEVQTLNKRWVYGFKANDIRVIAETLGVTQEEILIKSLT